MYCSACGKKCPEGAVYCAWCGLKLPELTDEQAESVETVEAAAGTAPAGCAGEEGSPAEESAVEESPSKPEPEQLDLDFEAHLEDEPEKPKQDPAHRIFQRPEARYTRVDDAQTVRPLAANPAQPLRGAAAAAAENAPQELPADAPDEPDLEDAPAPKGGGKPRARNGFDDEWLRPATDRAARDGHRDGRGVEKPAKRSLFGWGEGKSANRSPYEREGERPAKRSPYEREDERTAARSPYEREDERPAKRSPFEREAGKPAKRASFDPDDDLPPKTAHGKAERPKPPGSARGKAMTATGGMVTPPARRPPVKHSGPFMPQKRPRKDLFFEDLEMPAENFYDEVAEERALARRIRAIVSVALAVGVVMVAVWLMWTPGGQIVRAQLNLGAPASAYKALGDQDLASGQVQRAADAYHNALKLDPENYDYAMLVGKTKEMVGDRDTAARAYMVCVDLKPTAVEPYARLVELYKVMGDSQTAENWRTAGYAKTGDATLAPGA